MSLTGSGFNWSDKLIVTKSGRNNSRESTRALTSILSGRWTAIVDDWIISDNYETQSREAFSISIRDPGRTRAIGWRKTIFFFWTSWTNCRTKFAGSDGGIDDQRKQQRHKRTRLCTAIDAIEHSLSTSCTRCSSTGKQRFMEIYLFVKSFCSVHERQCIARWTWQNRYSAFLKKRRRCYSCPIVQSLDVTCL